MSREKVISDFVQKYDEKLFCRKSAEGKLCIFREGYYWDTFQLNDQDTLQVLRLTPHFVFAITHNWKKDGYEVPWGKDQIWERLHKCDLWKQDIVGQLEEQEDKILENSERKRKNDTEDFLYDFHGKFKKTFKDVNVSSLDKKRDIRRKQDNSIHNK